jgi:RNase H-fold protein (predicted Holliday junction resolvase)
MKYLKDDLNDKPIFPGKISEKIDTFLENLLKDCTERKEIKEIIIGTLITDYPESSETLTETIKKLKKSDDLELILDELKKTVEEDNLL